MITSVETEGPDREDGKNKEIRRRGVRIDVENLDVTQLRITPEVPPASVHKRLTLVKKDASDLVYKVINKKKTCKKRAASESFYKIMDKMKISKHGKPRFSCRIAGCEKQCEGRVHLYRHYCHHFKEDLLGLIGEGKDNCPYCGIKFQNNSDAVRHVGCVHNKLEEFLPKHLHIKSNLVKKSSKPKPKVVSSSGQLYKAKKPERTQTASNLSCGLCEKKFRGRYRLYEHYSQVHYTAQLRPFIDQESDQCSRCKIIHNDPSEANKIRHMGIVHGLLEKKNILPSHLRVPKISVAARGGKKSVEKAVPENRDLTKKPSKGINPESKGNYLKVPSTRGLVQEMTKDQDQHQNEGEKPSQQISPETDSAPETVKDLDTTIGKDAAAIIAILMDEITEEVCQNPSKGNGDDVGDKPVWTVAERECVFCYSDSD